MYVPAASMRDAASIPAFRLNHDAHWVVEAYLRKSSEGSREPGRQAFSVGLDSKAVDRGQRRMTRTARFGRFRVHRCAWPSIVDAVNDPRRKSYSVGEIHERLNKATGIPGS